MPRVYICAHDTVCFVPRSCLSGTRERGKGVKKQGKSEEKQSAIGSVRVSHPDQMEDRISLDAPAARITAYGSMRELAFLTIVRNRLR